MLPLSESHGPRIARAIDAGFGVVKFTRSAKRSEKDDAVNGVMCDHFVSMAIDADAVQLEVDSGRQRDTVMVQYRGRSYEVGKDVRHNIAGNDFGRDMTDAYYDSTVYHALMRGALAYMGDKAIDTLVLGLPMNHFSNKARVAKLEREYTGQIDLGHGKTVHIGKAVVQPQPFGGYISLGNELDGINETLSQYAECGIEPLESPDDLKALNVLIVDPGEFTLDWLMMTPGGAAQRVSSAASDAGRHRVLRDVHTLLCTKVGKPLGASFMADIDDALRAKRPFRFSGRSYDLQSEEFQIAIERAVEDPVRQLFEGLRGSEDRIDLVAVMGGSPFEVAAAIRKRNPFLPVYCPTHATGQDAPLYANLRGFQEWSEALVSQVEA